METNSIAINEAQVVLAEKRKSLDVMRTGIAILALPLTVIGFLAAASTYYDAIDVLHLLIRLVIFKFALIVFGTYLDVQSVMQMRRYDRLIHEIKLEHSEPGKYFD